MIVAIHQPQYLPWLGYFDKIDQADAFVFLDNVQFKKNEWQNRNRIKAANGWQWLTVPVRYTYPQLICEVTTHDAAKWQHKQKQTLLTNYKTSPYYCRLQELFEETFTRSWRSISELCIYGTKQLAEILGIETPMFVASELGTFPEGRDERLIAITKHLGGDTYLAGQGGKQYVDMGKYESAGIRLQFQDYHHPIYMQQFGSFEPYLSVIDLIFNCGDKSLSILRGQTNE